MSTTPEVPTGGQNAPSSKAGQMFKSCWSCRVISGGGLILAGAYVFSAARKVMRQGGPTSMGTVAQITFAASQCSTRSSLLAYTRSLYWVKTIIFGPAGLAAWGLVVITDPVGKAQKKSWNCWESLSLELPNHHSCCSASTESVNVVSFFWMKENHTDDGTNHIKLVIAEI